jgi:type III secretion protein C
MKKFNLSSRDFLLKCWLIAIVYQAGQFAVYADTSKEAQSLFESNEIHSSSLRFNEMADSSSTNHSQQVQKPLFEDANQWMKSYFAEPASKYENNQDTLPSHVNALQEIDHETKNREGSSFLNFTPLLHQDELLHHTELEPTTEPKEEAISVPEDKDESIQVLNLLSEAVKQASIPIHSFEPSQEIAQVANPINQEPPQTETNPAGPPQTLREISVNFNNVAMIEYIRFISRLSGKNFVFDDEDLLFNVTIVSEEPTSIENLMAALLQELKIRDLLLIEQGNNIIIHRNARVRAPSRIIADGIAVGNVQESELVTRVFRLNSLDPARASEIIRPLLSDDALVQVLSNTNTLIITDLATNVNKIAQLLITLDAPNNGITIGQYVVRNGFVETLVALAGRILQPIAQGNPFVLVPHTLSNSVYIVSSPYLVEQALAILENLDLNEGRTRVFPLGRGRTSAPGSITTPGLAGTVVPGIPSGSFIPGGAAAGVAGGTVGGVAGGAVGGVAGGVTVPGTFTGGVVQIPGTSVGVNGTSVIPGTIGTTTSSVPFVPGTIGTTTIPGTIGIPTIPTGQLEVEGRYFPNVLVEGEFSPGALTTTSRYLQDLPPGRIERTLFYIYKLKYRRGDQIEVALRKIADSLQYSGMTNADLIAAINSIQWIEATNSIIFTGTIRALEKLRELIIEIDIPLRQVFIEMLILETTLTDSLTYGVDWSTRFGGGNTAGAQAFLSGGSPIVGALDAVGPEVIDGAITGVANRPNAAGFARTEGFSLGVIGRHLTHNGELFNSIAALVRAVHTDAKANIILNPKIITEDNNTAEIFVGETTRYKTQSISNDLGAIITNNFQFLDVGTTLRVTPLIGNNDIVTLEIVEEVSSPSAQANISGAGLVDINLVPVLSKSKTLTRIHVPDGYFVILSGQISDRNTRTRNQLPCLGSVPIIGALSKQKGIREDKRNLMIFIRPVIIDTAEDLEYMTRRQQDIFREKTKHRRSWNFEIDEALDFLNIKPTDPDEIGCTIK